MGYGSMPAQTTFCLSMRGVEELKNRTTQDVRTAGPAQFAGDGSALFSYPFEFFFRLPALRLVGAGEFLFPLALRLIAQLDEQGEMIRAEMVQDGHPA
jgi:hypothetical protein